MKVFIVLASFVAVASASHLWAASPAASIESGSSTQFRSEDDYGNYQFGYDESHASGGSSRREQESNGIRRGSYSLSDADGRRRTVNFIADASGFHATVDTNEPGVESKDPADVLINKGGQAVVAASAPIAQVAYSAPAISIASAPAPIFASIKGYSAPAPAPIFASVKSYAAPAPLPAPIFSAPIKNYAASIAAPAPIFSAPIKGYAANIAAPAPLPAPVRTYATAAQFAAPTYETVAQTIEAPTPRAFSYAFGSTHVAPVAASRATYAAPAPLAQITYSAAPAPIIQQRVEY